MTDKTKGFVDGLAAMTPTDWLGLVILITLSILVTGVYVYVFTPSRKAEMDKRGLIPLNDGVFLDKE